MAQVAGNSANGYFSVTWSVHLSSALTPVEAVLGRAGRVGADDGLEDVGGRAGDPVLRVGDRVPALHEIVRGHLGVDRRLEVDALADGEGEHLGVGAVKSGGKARTFSLLPSSPNVENKAPRRSSPLRSVVGEPCAKKVGMISSPGWIISSPGHTTGTR